MKNNLFAAIAIVAVVFTVSCKSGGMSEETKTKMSTFETNWKAMSDQMTAWGTTMNTRMAEMDKMMLESMGGDMHMEMDSMTTKQCNDITAGMASMKETYKSTMDSVAAGMTQYTEWKKATMEAKDEAATNTGLDEWNAKLTGYTNMMTDWESSLSGMEAACKAVCDMMMHDMEGMHDMKMK